MEIYKVPTNQTKVRILLDDGRTLDGTLFTHAAGYRGSPETILERFNDPSEDFVPLMVGKDHVLLNKSGILMVQMRGGEDEIEGYREKLGKEVPVRLTLVGGTSIIGRLFVVMPPDRSRVIDYLNAAPRFIPLLGEAQLTIVHKAFVVSALSEAPAP